MLWTCSGRDTVSILLTRSELAPHQSFPALYTQIAAILAPRSADLSCPSKIIYGGTHCVQVGHSHTIRHCCPSKAALERAVQASRLQAFPHGVFPPPRVQNLGLRRHRTQAALSPYRSEAPRHQGSGEGKGKDKGKGSDWDPYADLRPDPALDPEGPEKGKAPPLKSPLKLPGSPLKIPPLKPIWRCLEAVR